MDHVMFLSSIDKAYDSLTTFNSWNFDQWQLKSHLCFYVISCKVADAMSVLCFTPLHMQENGISHGSVIGVTPFISIVSRFYCPGQCLFCVVNFAIYYSSQSVGTTSPAAAQKCQ
jgi:hypothetical protein